MSALIRHLALLVALATGVSSAQACKFRPDERPLQVRLADAPIVFEGRVISVDDELVTFRVDKAVRGHKGGVFMVAQGHSSCELRFAIGERWLYAGSLVMNPSQLLKHRAP